MQRPKIHAGVTILLGEPGSGKSTWLRAALERAPREACIAWDPNDEHGALPWDVAGSVREVLRAQASSRSRLRRVRTWGSYADFERLCAYLLRAGGPADGLTLAVDEGHVVCPAGAARHHPFRELVLRHRHLRVRLAVVGWRPAELPRYLTAAAPRFILHRTTRRLDVEWIERELDEATAAALPRLGVGRPLIWTPASASSSPGGRAEAPSRSARRGKARPR